MKKIALLVVCTVCLSVMASANTGDPIAKLLSQIEKADITLSTAQKDQINEIADQTIFSKKKTVKSKGQKGTRKDYKKEQRKILKQSIYNNVFTVDQRDKWNTYKGR